jgi:hypothetical protein
VDTSRGWSGVDLAWAETTISEFIQGGDLPTTTFARRVRCRLGNCGHWKVEPINLSARRYRAYPGLVEWVVRPADGRQLTTGLIDTETHSRLSIDFLVDVCGLLCVGPHESRIAFIPTLELKARLVDAYRRGHRAPINLEDPPPEAIRAACAMLHIELRAHEPFNHGGLSARYLAEVDHRQLPELLRSAS